MSDTPTPTPPQPPNRVSGPALIAAIVAACSLAAPLTMTSEGKRNTGYADKIATRPIPTTCFGHTGPEVRVGVRSTDQQCDVMLQGDMRAHARGAYGCAPRIAERVNVLAAVTDVAFNIGVAQFCRSTAARLFNAGDFGGGCRALGRFVYAGGRVRRGLQIRRRRDVSMCLTGQWR